ncbi:OmpA/MotB family protein [Halomonas sp. C05BenzN]|uniref:OmpA/MotB family protein n=1 Tax=Halomonas sp. C05BenzN TaxID=3411041 RepID=UPI003B9288D2
MLDRHTRESLLPGPQGDGDGEGWLMSYLDVLTLLITLFVLLLSLAGNGLAVTGSEHGGEATRQVSPGAQSAAIAVAGGLGPAAAGVQPRHDGLQPRFRGLEIEGVSVAEGNQGITLRIDDNLLFSSGRAELTAGGREVLRGLVATLVEFDGQVSVEGHTDAVPIATARFPSNWELSTGRAIAVLRYLAEQGVAKDRLRAIGYADTRPLESNEHAEGRAANRRVELLLTRET